MRFTIIHPSYGRPIQSRNVLDHWMQRAKGKHEYLVALNSDDTMLNRYIIPVGAREITRPFSSSVEAINTAAEMATGDIMVIVSDDQFCPNLWDELILKEVAGQSDFVVKTYDGLQKSLITMPIFDRVYYNRDRYVYFPGYKHLFCDTEFTDKAYMRRRVIVRNKLVFPHRQYSIMGTVPDNTALRNESTYAHGKALYQSRKAVRFGE
jgi:hypothetical protein